MNSKKYVKITSLNEMRRILEKGYKLIEIELDKSSGMCISTFDIHNKYKEEKTTDKIIVEKIFNLQQIKYYLSEEFNCRVVGLGVDKRKLKNGKFKTFFFVKFLYDNNLKIPKDNWMKNKRE